MEAGGGHEKRLRLEEVLEKRKRSYGRRSASQALFVVLTIAIILLVAGVLRFGWNPAGRGKFQFEQVEAYYHRNMQAGMLFIIRGQVVTPPARSQKGQIRVHASVGIREKGILARRTTPAGVMIPDEVLHNGDRGAIEAAISRAQAPEESAGVPTRRGTIPFMVVFFDVPGIVSSYELSADRDE